MRNPELFFILLFACPVLGYMLILGLKRLPVILHKRHAQRLLDSIKPSAIKELIPGPAEINGRVQSGSKLVVSPLSQTPCVFYRLQVEEFQTVGNVPDAGDNFFTCFDFCEPKQFTLQDSTGTISVATNDATFGLNPDSQHTGTIIDTPDHLRNLLEAKYAKGFHRTFFGFKLGANERVLRFTEYLLQEGDEVYTVGQAVVLADVGIAIKDGCIPLIVTEQNPNHLKQKALITTSFLKYLLGTLVLLIAFMVCLITLIDLL